MSITHEEFESEWREFLTGGHLQSYAAYLGHEDDMRDLAAALAYELIGTRAERDALQEEVAALHKEIDHLHKRLADPRLALTKDDLRYGLPVLELLRRGLGGSGPNGEGWQHFEEAYQRLRAADEALEPAATPVEAATQESHDHNDDEEGLEANGSSREASAAAKKENHQ